MVDEAHRTQSARSESLAGQMRAALPHAKFFGMTGTPVRNLATDTFALFGEETDRGRVLHRYSVSRSLLDGATVDHQALMLVLDGPRAATAIPPERRG